MTPDSCLLQVSSRIAFIFLFAYGYTNKVFDHGSLKFTCKCIVDQIWLLAVKFILYLCVLFNRSLLRLYSHHKKWLDKRICCFWCIREIYLGTWTLWKINMAFWETKQLIKVLGRGSSCPSDLNKEESLSLSLSLSSVRHLLPWIKMFNQ